MIMAVVFVIIAVLDLSGGSPLVPLDPPPSFHRPPLVQSKIHQKYIADPLWFYHKSSTVLHCRHSHRHSHSHRHHNHHLNVHFLLRLIQDMDGCFPNAQIRQPTSSDTCISRFLV